MLTASNLKKFCYVILLVFCLALTQDNVLLNLKQSIKFEFSKAYLLIPLVHLVCLLDMPGITFFFYRSMHIPHKTNRH